MPVSWPSRRTFGEMNIAASLIDDAHSQAPKCQGLGCISGSHALSIHGITKRSGHCVTMSIRLTLHKLCDGHLVCSCSGIETHPYPSHPWITTVVIAGWLRSVVFKSPPVTLRLPMQPVVFPGGRIVDSALKTVKFVIVTSAFCWCGFKL